eukprot:m.340007 g.340007  ORF g.340007 m.340007 type:complete len:864 (+) comp19079_c0_seq1:208-2799(+)
MKRPVQTFIMLTNILLSVLLLHSVAVAQVDINSNGPSAIEDIPYLEIIPERLVYANSNETKPASWIVLPFECCINNIIPFKASSGKSDLNRNNNAEITATDRSFLLTTTHDGVWVATFNTSFSLRKPSTTGSTFSKVSFVNFPKSQNENNMHLISDDTKEVTSIVTSEGLLFPSVHCNITESGKEAACVNEDVKSDGIPIPGSLHNPSPITLGTKIYLPSKQGLYIFEKSSKSPPNLKLITNSTITALASIESSKDGLFEIVVGTLHKIYMLTVDGTVRRWEWCTNTSTGQGGVLDEAITSLNYNGDGTLFIGNKIALNTYNRESGSYARVTGLQGLPYNDITALHTAYSSIDRERQLWIGTGKGFAVYNPEDKDSRWRYLYGPRWHPGSAVVSMASFSLLTADLNYSIVASATDGGLVLFHQQRWTLSKKAEWMEVYTARHNRNNLISDCQLQSYGDTLGPCKNVDSDNNGLWTSLLLVAAYMRHAVTKDASAATVASDLFKGFQSLLAVTDITGLPARSLCSNKEPASEGCAPRRATDRDPGCPSCGLQWRNSTKEGYEGYVWKSDASSDEIVGHILGRLVVAKLTTSDSERKDAINSLQDIVTRIVDNGFELIDWTGKPTLWARYSPTLINENRDWSDERGLQSLQMISMLTAISNVTGGLTPDSKWGKALKFLSDEPNNYVANMLNLKIETPCDDNYSDDELTFFPYYTAMMSIPHGPLRSAVEASLNRTFNFVRPGRSNLWAAIYMSSTQYLSAYDLESVRWNLRTWPVELVNWPVNNSHRLDIFWDAEFNAANGRDAGQITRVLPANERNQGRWNSDPFSVSAGGDGTTEVDPGAWLMPYWLARYHKLLGAPMRESY